MPSARLPIPGHDDNIWGNILNEFLAVEHNIDGTLKQSADIAQARTDATLALSVAQQVANATIADNSITKTQLVGAVQTSLAKADSALQQSQNLGDLPSADTARTNLGLGTAATTTATMAHIADFGAQGDGSADDSNAFQAAAVSGRRVYIGKPAAYYRITTTISFTAGTTFIGEPGAEIHHESTTSALLFSVTDTSTVSLVGLTIIGSGSSSPAGAFIALTNATDCSVRSCIIRTAAGDAVGSILLGGATTSCSITHNSFSNGIGSCIGLSGTSVVNNVISHNRITGYTQFGIRLASGASRNDICHNFTINNGLELIGVTSDSWGNRIHGNHAQGCGDNGISITGYQNTVSQNVCMRNQRAGIWIWGSFNTVTGNVCIANNLENAGNLWSGIGVSANSGGTGQYNTVVANYCDDDQTTATQWNGIRLSGASYTIWATGQSITAGVRRLNNLDIYIATTSGTTGVTTPTHTSGTVSDGGVSWRYERSFITTANAIYNTVSDNTIVRSQSSALFDVNNWAGNVLHDRTLVSERVSSTSYRVGTTGTGSFNVSINGADRFLVTETEIEPATDTGMRLGLSNRQFSSAYLSNGVYVTGTKVLGARRTGYSGTWTGTTDRATSYDTGTVTVAQLAARVAALEADLKTHGLVGP